MLYPLIFQPIFKTQVWGGRNLERLYGKPLPAGVSVGESWEISDRPEGVSVVANGPLAGSELRGLMEDRQVELIGRAQAPKGRYPLLVKILDAQAALSLQVHPPSGAAARVGGEPKTEMWYITDAAPGAELYLGLRPGTTRDRFLEEIKAGTVADCFHRLKVRPGDAVFLPSGRVHALGAGLVLFEIQQNSDTTYRVFDWNRLGLNGQPRELHIPQALECIDFADYDPHLIEAQTVEVDGVRRRRLVNDPLFTVDAFNLPPGHQMDAPAPRSVIIGMITGQLSISAGGLTVTLSAGQFCLVPACVGHAGLQAITASSFLQAQPG
jgi:mannose-6-phosphate isomerase